MEMHFGPSFWVGIALIIFIGILLYVRVPRLIAKSLDERAERIRKQLDEARTLREDAQALLASYQRKEREARKEAEDIVEHAKAEAKRAGERAREQMSEAARRRSKQAEEKIAQAEAQAIKQVRQLSADVAAAAARRLIRENLDKDRADALIDEAIGDLDKTLRQ